MKYHLSSRQAKELVLRATPLEIALPAPPNDPPDFLEWARSALIQYGEYIVTAEPTTLYVTPNDGDGLSGLIGMIGDQPPRGVFCITVEVVICELDPPVKARRERTRCQWPGCAVLGERRWPSP